MGPCALDCRVQECGKMAQTQEDSVCGNTYALDPQVRHRGRVVVGMVVATLSSEW